MKKYLSIATLLFCALAILLGLNSNTVMHHVWGIWYGNHLKWNEIDVNISNSEYFMPQPKDGKILIIADLKSNDAFIVLHAGARTKEFQKTFVESLCQPPECHLLNEQSFIVNGRRVDSISTVKSNLNLNAISFHQYQVIEGGNAWVEFFGDEAQYVIHKSTLDSIVHKLAV